MSTLPDVSGSPVVKQENIDDLMNRDKDGKPLLHRLFSIYLEETPRLLGELEKGLAARDGTLVYDTIHQMKGSAAAMGAMRVYAITEAALELCRKEAVFEISDLVGTIEGETSAYMRDVSLRFGL
jgi:HPt (histidine-containing phosphotransfer) domain-containing protein